MPHANPLPVTTDRATLRQVREADLAAFQAYRLDPVVGRYQGWSPMSNAAAQAFLNEMNMASPFLPGEWFQIGIADQQSNSLIGDIGVCVSSDGAEAEIGFTLARAAQGQGLALEAVRKAVELVFAVTDVQRIFAVTDARNLPAIKLLAALGMQRTETSETIFRGEPCLEHTFALPRASGA